jgi:hemoglobin
MAPQSVYEEIDGRKAVETVVADFYDRVFADADRAPYFADTDRADLYAHQVQFISSVAGGPVEYTGAEMREAHAHLAITDRDFEAVVQHLDSALRDNDVPDRHIETILNRAAERKSPILNR